MIFKDEFEEWTHPCVVRDTLVKRGVLMDILFPGLIFFFLSFFLGLFVFFLCERKLKLWFSHSHHHPIPNPKLGRGYYIGGPPMSRVAIASLAVLCMILQKKGFRSEPCLIVVRLINFDNPLQSTSIALVSACSAPEGAWRRRCCFLFPWKWKGSCSALTLYKVLSNTFQQKR